MGRKQNFIIPIFKGTLVVMLTNDAEEVIEEVGVPEWFEADRALYAHSIDASDPKGSFTKYVMVLNMHGSEPITHGVIAHEAAHIAGFVCQDRGISPSFRDDETFCYLLEWITTMVYHLIKVAEYTSKISIHGSRHQG